MLKADSIISHVIHACHLPDFDFVTITCFMFVLSGISLCFLISIYPIFDRYNNILSPCVSSLNPDWLYVNVLYSLNFTNLMLPVLYPFLVSLRIAFSDPSNFVDTIWSILL